jgi:hypothetical protein
LTVVDHVNRHVQPVVVDNMERDIGRPAGIGVLRGLAEEAAGGAE